MVVSEIWIVDDDRSISWVIGKAFDKQGYLTRIFKNAETFLAAIETASPDLVISDIHMPGISGFELIRQTHLSKPGLPVIIMTAFGDLDSAVDAYKYDAYEYLTKPFDIDELMAIAAKALSSNDHSAVVNPATNDNSRFLGDSAVIQEVFRIIGRISRSDMGVLIRGESGVGKELVAQAIHQNSLRANQPLVAINTAAIPAELLESELFGHEKGAFTGAHNRHIGRFEQADGATLFLDEIGDMPLVLQTRLLRVLSEGCFYRVGGRKEITVDVRIIAATNQELEKSVEQGRFRNDLFHRLNVLSVNVPPLRERLDDIPQLVTCFLTVYAENTARVKQMDHHALEVLQSYDWPGNIRELQNLCHQLAILSMGNVIERSDLPDHIITQKRPVESGEESMEHHQSWQHRLEVLVDRKLNLGESGIAKSLQYEFESILVQRALQHTGGHKQKAARLLGWGRNTLTRKMNDGQ